MSFRSRIAKLLAFLAVPLLILAACSSTGGRETTADDGETGEGQVAPTEEITIAMVTHAVPGDTFWDIVRKGAEENAAKNNVNLIYASDPEGSEQALLIDQYVQQEVDGLVVANAKPEAMNDSLVAAVEAGIPVVTINAGDAQWQDVGAITHFGQPEQTAGEAAGEELAEQGFTSAVCVIQEQGHVGLESRCEGVANTFPETEILYVDSADMPSVEADLTAKLQTDGGEDVMVTLGAPIATTALLAKETAGSDIAIATFDMNAEVAGRLADGELAFIVDQQPYLQGYQAVDAIWLATYGGFQVGGGEQVLTGPAIVRQDTAADVAQYAEQGVR